jgi:hypothetical protein
MWAGPTLLPELRWSQPSGLWADIGPEKSWGRAQITWVAPRPWRRPWGGGELGPRPDPLEVGRVSALKVTGAETGRSGPIEVQSRGKIRLKSGKITSLDPFLRFQQEKKHILQYSRLLALHISISCTVHTNTTFTLVFFSQSQAQALSH